MFANEIPGVRQDRDQVWSRRGALTRRDLLGQMATGLGAAALGTLLANDGEAADGSAALGGFPRAYPKIV